MSAESEGVLISMVLYAKGSVWLEVLKVTSLVCGVVIWFFDCIVDTSGFQDLHQGFGFSQRSGIGLL